MMANTPESGFDRLWKEYSAVFRDFDDLTLARWMCQTLGQLAGRGWRLSHPLVGAYRLAAQVGFDRQIWFKLLATAPPAYGESPCCRAPLLPLLTRDVLETGLVCQHCGDTAVPFDEIPSELQPVIRAWAEEYGPLHAVAHWEDARRKKARDYDAQLEKAARQVERCLGVAEKEIMPRLIEYYAAVIWEDQDECLEVRPEDIES